MVRKKSLEAVHGLKSATTHSNVRVEHAVRIHASTVHVRKYNFFNLEIYLTPV